MGWATTPATIVAPVMSRLRASARHADAEGPETEAVGSARRGGGSWGQSGDIVGTTRQAAQQRWAWRKEPKR